MLSAAGVPKAASPCQQHQMCCLSQSNTEYQQTGIMWSKEHVTQMKCLTKKLCESTQIKINHLGLFPVQNESASHEF